MDICPEVIIVELKIKVAVRVQVYVHQITTVYKAAFFQRLLIDQINRKYHWQSMGKEHSGELISASRQAEQTNPTTLGQLHKDAGSVSQDLSFPMIQSFECSEFALKTSNNKAEESKWES